MGKIVLLDELTINKIAAGEVIERPASVVKEMVENSIDAGARNITVEIKNGGISLIKIIDDGSGIAEDDMEISFERHATSKIRNADDLNFVKTMGFRGEALASVAAIANVEMISKRPEDEIGHKIVIEGGKVLEKTEIGAPNGTQITVKNLFYNTPVRYKFLKKDFTEAGYIEDAITRLALINKNVSFKLINTGKTVIQTNGSGDMKSIVYSIYGKEIANGITEVEYEYEDMKVTGVIGNKDIARSNRAYQLFFVNNRFVRDKNLSAAVEQAYRDILPTGKYGFVVLNLSIASSKIDVNVHPAKLEIRFENESNVFKAVYHAIKETLAKMAVTDLSVEEKIFDNNEESKQEEVNEEKNDEIETEFKPKNNSFSGFFKKILGNNEEDEDDDEKNDLQEIYENRKRFRDRLVNDFNRTKNEEVIKEAGVIEKENGEIEPALDLEKEEELKQINDFSNKVNESINKIKDDYVQEVKINNTIITNDTQPLKFNLRKSEEENLKDEVSSDTIRFDSNKINNNTEVVDTIKKAITDINDNSETKIIDLKEVENADEKKIDNEDESKIKEKDDFNKEDFVKNHENSITEKLMKLKMETMALDATQLIDTSKIREKELEEIPTTPEFANMYKKIFGKDVVSVRQEKAEENKKMDVSNALKGVNENISLFEKDEKSEVVPKINYKFIGTIFDTYILVEIKDEMYMIDKRAANERLVYEDVKKAFYNDEFKDSQNLLLADIVTLTPNQMGMARENYEMFKKSGFDYEEFGENTLKLTVVPTVCEQMNTKKLFLEILNEMDTIAIDATKEREEKFIATVASKTADNFSVNLSKEEIDRLLNKLFSLDNPFTYPFGKNAAIKISKTDMEKKFSRR